MLPYDDYYDLLGISPTASAAEITQAFRTLAKTYHPDSNIAHPDRVQQESFAYITAAYETLKDPQKRRAYDQQLRTQLAIAKAPARRTGAFWGGVAAGLMVAAASIALILFPWAMPWKEHEGKYQDSLTSRTSAQNAPAPIIIDVMAKPSKGASKFDSDLAINEKKPDLSATLASPSPEKPKKPVKAEGLPAPAPDPSPMQAKLPVAPEKLNAPTASVKPKPREEKDQPQINEAVRTPLVERSRSAGLTGANTQAPSDATRPPLPSRFAEEVAGLEAQIVGSADGSAAYRLISILTTATQEEDLRRASAVAKNEQTIELINQRLKEIAEQRRHGDETRPVSSVSTLGYRPISDCQDCPEMIPVPAGSFVMGSPPTEQATRSEEFPSRRVTIGKALFFSKTKISVGDWRACVREGGCRPTSMMLFMARPELPATRISWSDAQDYVRWLRKKTGKNYRIPTEAEWEYVSWRVGRERAQDSSLTPERNQRGGRFAQIFKERAGRPYGEPQSGQADAGDFWNGPVEWTADCWHPNYAGAPVDGSAWLGDRNGVCSQRVVRGGSLHAFAGLATKTARASQAADGRNPFVGFRVVRDIEGAPASIEAENK